MSIEHVEIELDKNEAGFPMQLKLKEMSGQNTVPNIYIGKNHLGGHDDF